MFEIGDLVTGIDNHRYFITNNNALMKVKKVVPLEGRHTTMLEVEVIKSLDEDFYKHEGKVLPVAADYFRLATPKDFVRFN